MVFQEVFPHALTFMIDVFWQLRDPKGFYHRLKEAL
jgi:hypothetical protein